MAKPKIKTTQLAYYVTVTKVDVIETKLEGETQRLEVPDTTYKRALYLDGNTPREAAEQEIERQLHIIFERMRETE